MWNRIRPMLPHAAIVLANAYLVFFLIDRVNTAMNFIDNNLTKGMLLAMCVLAVVNWRASKKRGRKKAGGKAGPPKPSAVKAGRHAAKAGADSEKGAAEVTAAPAPKGRHAARGPSGRETA